MTFPHPPLKNPRPFLRVGLLFAGIAGLLPMFLHPTTTFGHDLIVGVCGVLACASIGISVLSKSRATR